MLSRAIATAACLFTFTLSALAQRAVPDLGPVINLDGDNAFRGETLEESTRLLQEEIDSYADVAVRTLAYCTGAGSEILLYPTRVANTWGWRSTSYDEDPTWGPRIDRNRRNQQSGGDALRIAGEQAKKRGMFFFPSQRMNDGHYAFGKPPEEYPLAGKFWLENRHLEIKDSPIRGKKEYGHLLDFTHQQVRDYRLAQTLEAIDRYQDIMDGYELDFTRFQIFFPAGKAEKRAHLITDYVSKVRRRLDQLGEQNGRRYLLMVRVPPAPHNCRWAGLDVAEWASQGLIDVLVPSQMMNMGFEQPIDEFKEMAEPYGVKVYAGLLPRVGWGWDFPPTPLTAAAKEFGTPDRALSIPQLRAAVSNSLLLGADGLYLFNFSHYARWGQATSGPSAIRLAEPHTLRLQDKVFSISKAYWFDHEDGYEYRKQLPAQLVSGQSHSFQLLIGDELADDEVRRALRSTILRLGLRNADAGSIEVALNGQQLLTAAVEQAAVATFNPADEGAARLVKTQKDLASAMVQIPLQDVADVRRGYNEITVRYSAADLPHPILITDIELGIFYHASKRTGQ